MKLTTETIKGKKCDIHVLESGSFQTNVDGDLIEAPSLEQLRAKISNHIRIASKKISLPAVWWERDSRDTAGKIYRGTFTGIHGRTNNLLLRHQSGKAEQVSRWGNDAEYFSPEHETQLVKLSAALDAAKKAYDNFVEEHAIDVKEEIKKLLADDGSVE